MALFRTAALFFCLLVFPKTPFAQSLLLSLGGGFGPLKETSNILHYEQSFKAVSAQAGIEGKLGNHCSASLQLDWQFFDPIIDLALPILPNPLDPSVAYSIHRHQINVRGGVNYYFTEAFRGLYLGAFGTIAYQTITTQDYPSGSNYFSDAADPLDMSYYGGGLTYGYRFKIAPYLRLSASGTHQLTDSDGYRQLSHRWGLGADWAF